MILFLFEGCAPSQPDFFGSAGRRTGFIFSPLNTLKNTEKYKYTSP